MSSTQRLKYLLQYGVSKFWMPSLKPRIIYHHSVHPLASGSLSPERFQQQLTILQANNTQFLTFSDLIKRVMNGKRLDKVVSITFDDGYLDNYEFVLPILLDQGIPATFFIVSGMIKSKPESTDTGSKLYPARKMMTKRHLREMMTLGMEIGSHTHSHVHVYKTLKDSKIKAWDEIAGSRKELEDMIGSSVLSFAYPNGQKGVFNTATRSLLNQAGFEYAATTIWGHVDKKCGPLQVSRMEIKAGDTLDVFRAKMSGRYDFMHWLHRLRDGSQKW